MCKRPCQQDGRRGHLRKSLRRFSFEAQHDGGTDFLGEPIAAQMRLQEGRELVPRAPLRVSSLSVSVCVTTLFSSKPTLPFTRDHFKWTATAEVSGSLHSGTRSKAASNRASRKRDVNRDSISDCMFPVPDPLSDGLVTTSHHCKLIRVIGTFCTCQRRVSFVLQD